MFLEADAPAGHCFFYSVIDAPTPYWYQAFLDDTTIDDLQASVTAFLPSRNFPQQVRVYTTE